MPPHRQQPTRLPRPWDPPGKNTGVGCHFLREVFFSERRQPRSFESGCPRQWFVGSQELNYCQSCCTVQNYFPQLLITSHLWFRPPAPRAYLQLYPSDILMAKRSPRNMLDGMNFGKGNSRTSKLCIFSGRFLIGKKNMAQLYF